MSNEVTLSAGNFEAEVVKSPVPVLIDFWAAWCNPCRMISPFIEEIAEEYAERLKVGKVNVDEEGDLAARHEVVSIPTLIVYKGGEIVGKKIGAIPKRDIEALIREFL
jgi:thioredoxin 1